MERSLDGNWFFAVALCIGAALGFVIATAVGTRDELIFAAGSIGLAIFYVLLKYFNRVWDEEVRAHEEEDDILSPRGRPDHNWGLFTVDTPRAAIENDPRD